MCDGIETSMHTVEQLDDQLSTPTPGVIQALQALEGDILVLGAGGKMGPTLARMALRASQQAGIKRRVIAVSRFSSPAMRQRMTEWGLETIGCDLLDEASLAALPRAALVVFMTGMKFGATDQPELTWAMNCYLPALICRRFPHSRMAVFSSGNIYGLTPVTGGGSREEDPLQPVGEYAMTVLGRERMFSYFSRLHGIPMVVLRLNYASELRYGVLVDLARLVWQQQPIDLHMGWVNVIWQAEANALALQALQLAQSPPRVLNLAGPEIVRVAAVATRLGELLGRAVQFCGTEGSDALLSNAEPCYAALGRPRVSTEQMLRWTADWVRRSGEYLGKPTHFQDRSGQY
jgi:nucleoside-diphosphate-sugar epimerase